MANRVTRFFGSRPAARVVGSVGRLMVTSGAVVLLLVAYQLWGTNLQTAQSQDELADEFTQAIEGADTPAPADHATGDPGAGVPDGEGPDGGVTTTTAPPPGNGEPGAGDDDPVVEGNGAGGPEVAPSTGAIPIGQPVGRVSIPSIGLGDFYFVEGTGVDQLKRGAAHYPATPLPGQAGNAAIAGHRTTYGAPFHNIDDVEPGDRIEVRTLQGTFTYETRETIIVEPSETWVLDQGDANQLTLTACHPKFSAAQRIVLFADLVETPVEPVAEPPGTDASTAADTPAEVDAGAAPAGPAQRDSIDAYEDEPVLTFPGAWWGLGTVALWLVVRLGAWTAHRSQRFPRWIPYVAGTPVCLVMLYFFFGSFSFEAFALSLNLSV